jgi:hypothetical protein
MADNDQRTTFHVTLYREDSVTTVLYERVKHTFWTANGSVLVIAQYAEDGSGRHEYIHWLREHLCWFKVRRETVGSDVAGREEDELPEGLPVPVGYANGHSSR